MRLIRRRDLGDGVYTEVYEDDRYEYTFKCAGYKVVDAKPFSPYDPYITIVDNEAAKMSFFDGAIFENRLNEHIKGLEYAPVVIKKIRATFFK